MDRMYFMHTPRVAFSTWTLADEPLAFQLWGNPQVTRFISRNGYSDTQVTDRLKKEIANGEAYGLQYWPFFERESKEFIGVCGIRPYQLQDKVYELGFHLRPEFWGKGLAQEAAIAALDYAKNHIDASQIVAGHHPENLASKKVLLKLGFHYTEPHYFEPTGLMHLLYGLY